MFEQINNKIIETLGIDKLPKDEQKDRLEFLGATVYQDIIARTFSLMNEEDKDKFEEIVSSDDVSPEQIFSFLTERIPDLEQIAIEEANKYKE